MTSIKVFLVGEGANDLGGWSREPEHRAARPEPGVLESIMRLLRPEGWHIAGATRWGNKRLPLLNRNNRDPAEHRKVLQLQLEAEDKDCDLLVFSRDRDRDADRLAAVEAGIESAQATSSPVRVAGGLAVECLESWLLALNGQTGTESLSVQRASDELAKLGVPKKTPLMVAHVEQHGLGKIPTDATSLYVWTQRVKDALTP